MGKAIITVQLSADASIGPNIDWLEGGEQEDAGEDEVRLADALLLGRKTYEALSAIWSKTAGEFADRVNSMPKYVASTFLVEPLEWKASLIKHGLIEEVHFWVHPIVWSAPSRPFHGLGHVRMNRKVTTVVRSGVTLQNYEPVSVEE